MNKTGKAYLFANLRKEMSLNGFTIKALAKKVGVSEATLVNKLNGNTDFYLKEVNIITNILNKEQAYLFKRFK